MNFLDFLGKGFGELARRLYDLVEFVRWPRRFADSVVVEQQVERVRRIVFYILALVVYFIAINAALGQSENRPDLYEIGGTAALLFLVFLVDFPAAYISSRWFDKKPLAMVLLVFVVAMYTITNAVLALPMALFLASEHYGFKICVGVLTLCFIPGTAIWFGYSFGIAKLRRVAAGVSFATLRFLSVVALISLSSSLGLAPVDFSESTISPFHDPIGTEAFKLRAINFGRDSTVVHTLRETSNALRHVNQALDGLAAPDSISYEAVSAEFFRARERWNHERDISRTRLGSKKDSIESRISRASFGRSRGLLEAQHRVIEKAEFAIALVDSLYVSRNRRVVLTVWPIIDANDALTDALESHTASMQSESQYLLLLGNLSDWFLSFPDWPEP